MVSKWVSSGIRKNDFGFFEMEFKNHFVFRFLNFPWNFIFFRVDIIETLKQFASRSARKFCSPIVSSTQTAPNGYCAGRYIAWIPESESILAHSAWCCYGFCALNRHWQMSGVNHSPRVQTRDLRNKIKQLWKRKLSQLINQKLKIIIRENDVVII